MRGSYLYETVHDDAILRDQTLGIRWWERVALWFVRGEWSEGEAVSVYFKRWRGHTYVLKDRWK